MKTLRRQTFSDSIKTLHKSIPGRMRVHVEKLYRNLSLADHVEIYLKKTYGVLHVNANPLTGNILILFRLHKTSQKKILNAIKRTLNEKPTSSTPVNHSLSKQSSDWHTLSLEQIASRTQSSLRTGLQSKFITRQRSQYGSNHLPSYEQRSDLSILLNQFQNLPVALLIGSAALTLATGGLVDAAVITAVIIFNGWIGFRMESSAERTIHSIIKVETPVTQVIRDGKETEVPLEDLVVGDLILLRPGSIVPVDARLIDLERLTVDESFLTGESLPIYKSTRPLQNKLLPLGDRMNMVFKGSTITGGSGTAITVGVGTNTEIGQIQKLISKSDQPKTPLQRQLEYLGNQMVAVCLFASGTIFLIGFLRGRPFLELLKTSVSLAVAAIPESLPTVATMTLARGVKNLEQHHVLVRSLDAIETLANVNVLCLDKTGTLTMNQMEVTSIRTFRNTYRVTASDFGLQLTQTDLALSKLLKVAILCNESKLLSIHDNKKQNGSPTESALLRMSILAGMKPGEIRKRYPILSTQYRSESHQFMKTTHQNEEERLLAIKGSPEQVLALCTYIHTGRGKRPINASDRKQVLFQNDKMAKQGLRVLGFASGSQDGNLTWLGLTGMMDPLRAGMIELLPRFHEAGIETRLITGDQKSTAETIGKAIGVKKIFARVSPSKKLKLIQELQQNGKVVAMIGDGINDGPALRNADVGIAMAARGADVASQAADIVLPSDNLEGMLAAIEEGRTVHEDIRKAINYIVTQNLSELFYTFTAVIFENRELFTPLQFLWLNLVTDIFPELALAQEPANENIMKNSPVDPLHSLLSAHDLQRLGLEASILTAASLLAYSYGFFRDGSRERAKSLSFMTLTSSSFLYTISARSETHTIFDREQLRKNKYIPLSIGVGFFAEIVGIYTPGLRNLLGMQNTKGLDLFISTAGSVIPLLIIESTKFIRKRLAA